MLVKKLICKHKNATTTTTTTSTTTDNDDDDDDDPIPARWPDFVLTKRKKNWSFSQFYSFDGPLSENKEERKERQIPRSSQRSDPTQ